jgi:hypothetical protein
MREQTGGVVGADQVTVEQTSDLVLELPNGEVGAREFGGITGCARDSFSQLLQSIRESPGPAIAVVDVNDRPGRIDHRRNPSHHVSPDEASPAPAD